MIPFPQNLMLWRTSRGLTQKALAGKAGIPRPNLVAIENGARDITLRTLRALAAGLKIQPGLLVDGIPPTASPASWTRSRLERIAKAVVNGTSSAHPLDNQIRDHLSQIMEQDLLFWRGRMTTPRGNKRKMTTSWLWLKAHLSKETMESLIQRIREHAKKTN